MQSSRSPEQTDKNKKYDRQIRLWGEDGQNYLENSNVCIVNATCLGCEVLKSLVLPGIGSFTIVDGNKVTDDDLGVNFFVEVNNIGQPRATCCMRLLREMNLDVNGDAVEESVDYILANRSHFFNSFDVVVASNLNEQTLLKLSKTLWEANVPFIYCRSLGMYGSIRLQIKEHCIVEVHPDNRQFDLRILHPFATLKKYFEETPVTSKVPWPCILYKFLQQWKEKNNGQLPRNYKEKSLLRDMIQNAMTSNEENYEEAIRAVNTSTGTTEISGKLLKILNDEASKNITKQTKPFWIMIKALKEFMEEENGGLLPLPGILPDMTADTEPYIKLQNIYRQQSMQDAASVYRRCQSLIKELGLPIDTITEKDVRVLCREASNITVIRGTPIADEYKKNGNIVHLLADMEAQGRLLEYYIALRAYERFLNERGTIPGEYNVENDTSCFKSITNKMLTDLGAAHGNLNDDVIHEVCHLGGAEIHTTSAYIGGCAAQEAIKIITKQYIPLNNTFIYNGINTQTMVVNI